MHACFLSIFRSWSRRSPTVEILLPSRECLRLSAPVTVKEVLIEYPRHVIFMSSSLRSAADRSIPLHQSYSLLPGHLYVLVPDESAAFMEHSASLPTSVHKPPSSRSRKVSFAIPSDSSSGSIRKEGQPLDDTSKMTAKSNDPFKSVQYLWETTDGCISSPSEGVVRLKIVMPRKQAETLLRHGSISRQMLNDLLCPPLRNADMRSNKLTSPAFGNISSQKMFQSVQE
ncbi:hypothetical protein KP509_37G010100 [Ceratopteris richardii]|uniref:Uncharacterized protein n=1 Tax=Ceratopteris richardii TaxID=49495 RepID=A0A8T2Q6E3_CERRI|nr:hypothetical protein KP509_37G010100 [Ceratopteris richardii]